jgi:heme oxygenase
MKPLSIMLREGTMASHRAAEQTAFVKAFLQGSIRREAYAKHLALLRSVYGALESNLLNNAADVCVARIYFPELTPHPGPRFRSALLRDERRGKHLRERRSM